MRAHGQPCVAAINDREPQGWQAKLIEKTELSQSLIFTQFSDQLLTANSEMRQYYTAAYTRMPGYVLPPHFFEIPYWIPVIAGKLSSAYYAHKLHIVTDLNATLHYMREEAYSVFLFSVLEANVEQVLYLARNCSTRMIVGGYTDPAEFADFPHVTYVADVAGLKDIFPVIQPSAVLDYSLFRGQPSIPRFSLSTGCSYRCTFCTVPTKVIMTPRALINAEALALEPLEFRLIFLDDKSFGEAPNWRLIADINAAVCAYNKDFAGFIIQTSPSLACRRDFLAVCYRLGVRYVEFGVETVNDAYLAQLRKPFRVVHLNKAIAIVRRLGLRAIPNIILGIPGDDYRTTIDWVERNADVIPAVNINWLAIHHGNERGNLGIDGTTVADRDQNSDEKTWLTPAERSAGWAAARTLYDATCPGWRTVPQVDRVTSNDLQKTVVR
jgi:Radical SAM superfamily